MGELVSTKAHLVLGGVRLFMGSFALFAPHAMSRRMGIDPEANPSAIYPLRMFGVRTVVLGLELLIGRRERRAARLDVGVLIHASDTLAAATAGLRGYVPLRVGLLATGVSALNTALSVLARRPPRNAARGVLTRYRTRRLARRSPALGLAARTPIVRDLFHLE